MFQGFSLTFLYVLFCGIGLAFLCFFIQVFQTLLCSHPPRSVRPPTESSAQSRGSADEEGDRELAATRNVLQVGYKDSSIEREVGDTQPQNGHTLV